MNWTEVTIYTTSKGIDPVTGALLQLGINGFVIQDAQDFEDFLQDTTIYWDYVDDELMKLKECETTVTVYLADNMQGVETLASIRESLDRMKKLDAQKEWGRLSAELKGVKEEDWENNWKQYFKPFPVGEKFVIKPTWEVWEKQDGRTILEIDPSSSFGTGSHHTTQLCITRLEKLVKPGDMVLDMGCGSGILGIAAILMGANYVTGVDIDENSVRIARENFAQNGVSFEKFQLFCGNVVESPDLQQKIGFEKYNVIAANIVADVILAMSNLLPRFLKPGGVLITSGIIEPRKEEVKAGLEAQGLIITGEYTQSEWVCYTATKE